MVVLVTVVAVMLARRAVDRDIENRFAAQSETLVASIQAAIGDAEVRLLALEGLFRASEAVTPGEYADFASDLDSGAGVAGMAFMPVVAASDLGEFQQDMASRNAGYEVFELDGERNRIPVGSRDVYFPIKYFEPADALDRPLGLDAGSPPGMLPYLLRAVSSDTTVATPLLPLATTGQQGLLLYRRVQERSGRVTGLVAAPIILDDLIVDRVPESLDKILDWTIRDVTDEAGTTGAAAWTDAHIPVVAPIGEGTAHTEVVMVADRLWQFDMTLGDESPLPSERNEPVVMLFVGLAAAIVTSVIVSVYLRSREVSLQMQSMRDMLEAKDEFLAAVSHGLRTPLTSVLGYAELLRDDADAIPPGERSELVATIAEQASDIAGLIDDLLVVGRDEHGTLVLVAVPVNVRAQTAQVLENLDLSDRIHVECSDSAVRALADPERVRQIVRNLITNAVAYGGPNVQMTITPVGDQLVVEVVDDGPGVPPEHAARMFDPYYRSHTSSGTPGRLGLGLTVSRTLARRMGGELSHHTIAGNTIFRLTLPISSHNTVETARMDNSLQFTASGRSPDSSPLAAAAR
jgi:signal transduction histidine kinase